MSPVPENKNSTKKDAALAASLFVLALAIGSWYVPYFANSGGKAWFYQEQFGPAVMAACGQGYVNPNTPQVSGFDDFLERKRDSIACNDVSGAPTLPLTSMQRAFRYLMLTVSATWRLRGRVAWSALTPLYALLYAITLVLAYAIFRQGMGLALSWCVSLALAVSALQLNNLPHLRDYGKAPFVLALVLIAIRIVRPPASAGRVLKLALIAGVVSGIGVGFRNDLLVAIPAFMAVIALFLPVGLFGRIGLRVAALAVYVATVLVTMAPMWSIYTTGGGSSSQHLVLLGLTRQFGEALRVDNSRLYEWGFEYRDELALAMIDNYADRRLGEHKFLPMYSSEYDRAGTRYLADIGSEFPADLLSRVYASTVRVMGLPYSTTTSALMAPMFVQGSVQRIWKTRAWVLRVLTPLWPWTFALTFVVLSLGGVRLGLVAALFVFYVSGYPALQFQERHLFHLEFIGWWVLGFSVTCAGRALGATVSHDRRQRILDAARPVGGLGRATVAAVALWCVLAVGIIGPLWLLRRYQREHVPQLLRAIEQAPREELPRMAVPAMDGRLRFESPSLASGIPADEGVHAAYVVAELGGAHCDALKIDVTQRYVAREPQYDFTHTVTVPVPLSDTPVQLFFPAYFHNPGSPDPTKEAFGFAGVELPGTAADCLLRLSQVRDASQIPVLLDLQLRPRWEDVTPYSTISGVEGRANPPEVYAFPADLTRSIVKRSLAAQPDAFGTADIAKRSKTFQMLDHEWRVDGVGGVGGRGPLLYLVEMKPRPFKKDSFVIAEGRIEKGGVTFGLVRNDAWAVQLHVTQTGDFHVVIQVPEDGEYKFVLANNLLGMSSLENRLTVTRVGMVRGDAVGR